MKKILLLLSVFTLIFTSCSNLDDIYAEIDAQETALVDDLNFSLSEDDYAFSGNEAVEKAKSFSNFSQAEELIPTILDGKYPLLGKGSTAKISFSFDRLKSITAESDYTVSDADYESQGGNIGRFKNFTAIGQVTSFLNTKFTEAKRGELVDLTYNFRPERTTFETTTKFFFTDEWVSAPEFESADYTAMGQSFSNFDNFETAEFRTGVYLASLPEYTFAEKGDVVYVTYTYTFSDDTGRKFVDVVSGFTYDGVKFNVNSNTLQFGHDGSGWALDNTIKYTFTADDYTTVGTSTELENDTETSFTDALGNLNRFGNFNRTGSASAWSDEMMIKAVAVVLNKIAPTVADGQKYVVTVAVFNGSPATESFSLIKEGGVWVAN